MLKNLGVAARFGLGGCTRELGRVVNPSRVEVLRDPVPDRPESVDEIGAPARQPDDGEWTFSALLAPSSLRDSLLQGAGEGFDRIRFVQELEAVPSVLGEHVAVA